MPRLPSTPASSPPVTLVTGGGGFAGAALVRALLEEGGWVSVLDNWSTGSARSLPDHPRLDVVTGDVRDGELLRRVFGRIRPQRVVHLAARHFIPDCNADPDQCWEVNTVGTLALFEALRVTPVERVVLASTAAVYPVQEHPCREDGPVGPTDIYGASKLACEGLAHRLAAEHGCSVACARLFNLFGPGETNPHVIPAIISQLGRHGPLRLGNLQARRDYVHVGDVCRAIQLLLADDTPGCEIYNVGAGLASSVADLIGVVADELGRRVEVEVVTERIRHHDRPTLVADPSKLRARVGWSPRVSLREGLASLVRDIVVPVP